MIYSPPIPKRYLTGIVQESSLGYSYYLGGRRHRVRLLRLMQSGRQRGVNRVAVAQMVRASPKGEGCGLETRQRRRKRVTDAVTEIGVRYHPRGTLVSSGTVDSLLVHGATPSWRAARWMVTPVREFDPSGRCDIRGNLVARL
ncbi:MAG: hypothetical protein JWO61_279 [Candidatus Saccharibacteria bacterium]|nr:hypothetical protein [Candidatus Saccharibacteria bacterium]